MNTKDYISDKAYAKINLSFRVLGKASDNYHAIESIITFLPDIYDKIMIKHNRDLNIKVRGKFSNSLKKQGGDTLVKSIIFLLKNKYYISDNFEVIIDKNIPIGSGLGGGSADAAAAARIIIKMYDIKINQEEMIELFSKLGADIPACFNSYNQIVTGFGEKLSKLIMLNKKVWTVLVKPMTNFQTKEIFQKLSKPYSKKANFNYNYKNLINDINSKDNDLQEAAKKYSRSFTKLLHSLPKDNCITFPRMTGSGSAIFTLFDKESDAKKYIKNLEKTNTRLWKKLSRVLL